MVHRRRRQPRRTPPPTSSAPRDGADPQRAPVPQEQDATGTGTPPIPPIDSGAGAGANPTGDEIRWRSGPPADWVERVRAAAPHLLVGGTGQPPVVAEAETGPPAPPRAGRSGRKARAGESVPAEPRRKGGRAGATTFADAAVAREGTARSRGSTSEPGDSGLPSGADSSNRSRRRADAVPEGSAIPLAIGPPTRQPPAMAAADSPRARRGSPDDSGLPVAAGQEVRPASRHRRAAEPGHSDKPGPSRTASVANQSVQASVLPRPSSADAPAAFPPAYVPRSRIAGTAPVDVRRTRAQVPPPPNGLPVAHAIEVFATTGGRDARPDDRQRSAPDQAFSWPLLALERKVPAGREGSAERNLGIHRAATSSPAERHLLAERRFPAERRAADPGESIDRWPTLPDPVPDDEPAQIPGLESERWARLDREQRSA